MHQIRIHGRGGQGVVTAAELLSVAAFLEGKESQAFPSFGSERMGAPVQAFCRIDDVPIRSREPVVTPDVIIIQDATLLSGGPGLFTGLTPDGFVLVNTVRPVEALKLGAPADSLPPGHVRAIAASEIALRHLRRPLPNVPLLGAFVALTGMLRLDSLLAAVREKFPGPVGEKNAAAAEEAYQIISGVPAEIAAAGVAGSEAR